MSAIAAPRAPRAMVEQGKVDSVALSLEQIFEDAAKVLYPRLALFEALAKFKDRHTRRQQSNDDICEARRQFLDAFAYLCDIEKGGATVTAAGLQKLPYSNFLWLAANEGIPEDVLVYATRILQRLKEVDSQTQKAVQEDIFQLVVEKSSPRLEFYKTAMQKHARNCRMQLRQENSEDIGAIRPNEDDV